MLSWRKKVFFILIHLTFIIFMHYTVFVDRAPFFVEISTVEMSRQLFLEFLEDETCGKINKGQEKVEKVVKVLS